MGDIILAKHGDPWVIPSEAPSTWSLSPAGRQSCADLATRIVPYDPSRIVSSGEPKAIESAKILGAHLACPTAIDPDLRENDRSGVPFYEDRSEFDRRIEEFFGRPSIRVVGLETADQAYSRFLDAVRRIQRAETEAPVLVVSHGAAISLLVSRANDLDAFSFWSEFGFTSFAVLVGQSFALKELVHP